MQTHGIAAVKRLSAAAAALKKVYDVQSEIAPANAQRDARIQVNKESRAQAKSKQ
jgi:hypothetical protein